MPLARRVIPIVLMRGHQSVRGNTYGYYRPRTSLRDAIQNYETRNIDELVLLDVAATADGKEPNISHVKNFASALFCPLTVGGGVTTTDHFRALLAAGADKVAINTAAIETPDLISAAANKFGAQAVVVSIDVKGGTVWTRCGTHDSGQDARAFARSAEAMGAGELLVNAIDRDGTESGYDLDLVESVSGAVGIPVVACGGAGSYEHMKQALDAGAHAVAASTIFVSTDATPKGAAKYLAEHGYPTRLAA